ncbi:MAG: hypothetical protein ACLTMR_01800 [Faecalibacillus sp.]
MLLLRFFYPFTPTLQITKSIIEVAQKPVFAGVGGGTTAGPRVNILRWMLN